MHDGDRDSQRQLAVLVADKASSPEKDALRLWLGKLLDIRASKLTRTEKAARAVAVTIKAKTIWPLTKIVATYLKERGWDNRSAPQRVGLSAAAAGLLVFGWQMAGITALGGAVAVPLWIVLGAGGMFATYALEELGGSLGKTTRAHSKGVKEGSGSVDRKDQTGRLH